MIRFFSSSVIKSTTSVLKYNAKQLNNSILRNFATGDRFVTSGDPIYTRWLPRETNAEITTISKERGEIEVRVLKTLSNFDKVNLRSFNFKESDFEHNLKFDSLERIALICAIENEFSTVFEENVFDNFRNVNQLVNFLESDSSIL